MIGNRFDTLPKLTVKTESPTLGDRVRQEWDKVLAELRGQKGSSDSTANHSQGTSSAPTSSVTSSTSSSPSTVSGTSATKTLQNFYAIPNSAQVGGQGQKMETSHRDATVMTTSTTSYPTNLPTVPGANATVVKAAVAKPQIVAKPQTTKEIRDEWLGKLGIHPNSKYDGYDMMQFDNFSTDQKNEWNNIYNTSGKKAADTYFLQSVNKNTEDEAKKNYDHLINHMPGSDKSKNFLETRAIPFAAGMNNTMDGLKDAYNSATGNYAAKSPIQTYSDKVKSNLVGDDTKRFENNYNVGGQVVSIASQFLPESAILGKVGALASSYGNNYREGLQLDTDRNKAKSYGVTKSLLNYGIDTVADKANEKIPVISDGVKENLTDAIDPYIQKWIYGKTSNSYTATGGVTPQVKKAVLKIIDRNKSKGNGGGVW